LINLQLNFASATSEVLLLYSAVQYDVIYSIDNGLLSARF
jgi:hypothetical protein